MTVGAQSSQAWRLTHRKVTVRVKKAMICWEKLVWKAMWFPTSTNTRNVSLNSYLLAWEVLFTQILPCVFSNLILHI